MHKGLSLIFGDLGVSPYLDELIRTFLPRFKGFPTDSNDFDFYSLNLQTIK